MQVTIGLANHFQLANIHLTRWLLHLVWRRFKYLEEHKVKFFCKECITPKFFKAHPVPLALQQRVTAELDRFQAAGIIVLIQVSDWVVPIVPITKKDGSIRICGDYKLTVNQATQIKVYPCLESRNYLLQTCLSPVLPFIYLGPGSGVSSKSLWS